MLSHPRFLRMTRGSETVEVITRWKMGGGRHSLRLGGREARWSSPLGAGIFFMVRKVNLGR